MASLEERLGKIKAPKLQNQRETAIVLSAIEDTLREQKHEFTPTAYFAALLALLSQAISTTDGIVNKELATSVVYLLDIVTSHVPPPLLRSKFSQILTSLAPALTHPDADAPLLRPAIGCLESLLLAQDAAAWALPSAQVGPRRAMAGLLTLAVDHRPKIRKRAQEALAKVLQNGPPSPSLDHPAADMCAETALHSLREIVQASSGKKGYKGRPQDEEHHPGLIHALQLVKTVSSASRGWPSKRIDALCETLLEIAKSSNEYLTMASFEVFETVFAGMADEMATAKIPRLMEAITELRPSQNDSQLLPPWIAVLSRGYDVSAQLNPEDTFLKLPELFEMISGFLASMSHNIRISASECLISLASTCIPVSVVLEPSIYDEKVLEKLGSVVVGLLSVKYQAAWMEVFNVLSALFYNLKWRSAPLLNEAVNTVGELRGNDSFNGKKEADVVLGKAVEAMGPEAVLSILPLNLEKPKAGQPGRAWMLPILRDSVINANIAHFRSEFVPLSEAMFQRIIDFGGADKTMEIKIFETIVSQIWALLPGYCMLPLDLVESFDQSFAEQLSNLLYSQTELRVDICKALQLLVEMNKEITSLGPDDKEDLISQKRITAEMARTNIQRLSSFAGNLLAVLFNVYSQTLPQHRGYILQCINAYLSITPEKELMETFTRVTGMLEEALQQLASQTQADKQKEKQSADKMPPTSHTLMDLVITISVYLPRSSFATLFSMAALILPQSSDPQLQKKAYKLLPRLATSEVGAQALKERNVELQTTLLSSAASAAPPARRDRLDAIAAVVTHMPQTSLHFIPSILSEVVISAKEVNEKARTSAFDLLVLMGKKMAEGGSIEQSKIPHMPADAPTTNASLEEYFTMISAGLAGTTPHMISASITALTRVLYEFRTELPERVLEDLVSTMDLFLASNNLEVVRSVLGFVKVATTSLPDAVIKPRLESLVKGLMGWSHEHKARFRSKVKHIFERVIRRFGFEAVERYCPEEDKKLLVNIRKTKERAKRKKDAAANGDNDEKAPTATTTQRRSKFASEFDEAVYGSDDDGEMGSGDGEDPDSPASDDDDGDDDTGYGKKATGKKRSTKGSKSYIVEDAEEPLDLLDRRALGHISSTKPVRLRGVPGASERNGRSRPRVDVDGKLLLGGDEDAEMGDGTAANGGDGGGGVGAYVDAVKGRDAVQRGRGGRLKFSNRRSKGGDDGGDEMDLDDGAAGQEDGSGGGGGGLAEKRKEKSVRFGNAVPANQPRVGGGGRGGGSSGRGRGGGSSGRGAVFRKGLDGRKGRSGSGSGSGSGGMRRGGSSSSSGRGDGVSDGRGGGGGGGGGGMRGRGRGGARDGRGGRGGGRGGGGGQGIRKRGIRR